MESSPAQQFDSQLLTRLGTRLPFVVGVTGHREIAADALSGIESQVRKFLSGLRANFPNTPLILLTPLAEGADRIVAKIASEPEIGATLVCPLPMPQKLYENDFKAPGSLDEFRSLLKTEGATCFELPLAEGLSIENVAKIGPSRSTQYAMVGAFIVRHCNVLIALWDGAESEGLGGTADIVRFKLEGLPASIRQMSPMLEGAGGDDPVQLGPVYHIFTPRTSEPQTNRPAQALYPKSYEYDNPNEAGVFYRERIFQPIEDFNAQPESLAAAENISETNLLDAKAIEKESPTGLTSSLLYIDRLFARADALALAFQKKTHGMLFLLSLLVGGAALALDISEQFYQEPEAAYTRYMLMGGFPLLMLLAFIFYFFGKRGHFQDRYQDYRALAEGLRVQFYWRLAGISDSVANHYLGKQRSELYWIRRACMTAQLFEPDARRPLQASTAEIIRAHWIQDQLEYFTARSASERRKLHAMHFLVKFLFWSGFLVSAFIVAAGIAGSAFILPEDYQELTMMCIDHHSLTHQLLSLYIVIAAVSAALLHNFVEKSALESHVKQYTRMKRIFSLDSAEIDAFVKNGDFENVQRTLLSVGQEALTENGDWLITHRERPVQIPRH